MKRLIIVLSILSVLGFGACTKSVELDIIESRCKDFRISDAKSEFSNPNCPKDITGNTINASFNYSGDKECLNSIHMVTKFFDVNNNELFPKSLSADSLHISDANVSVGNGTASFKITFDMNSEAEYENINYFTVNFYTKNENLNLSNKLAIVKNSTCASTLAPPTSTSGTITVKNKLVKVSIWDDAAEDGDIITIIVNGVVVEPNVQIFHAPKTFDFTIDPAIQNYIQFYAVNEGTSSPNTAAGTINDGFSTQSFSVGMKQGESISYSLVYQGL